MAACGGGAGALCVVCGCTVPMADCPALWCKLCYKLCEGTANIKGHDTACTQVHDVNEQHKEVSLTSAGSGPTGCCRCAGVRARAGAVATRVRRSAVPCYGPCWLCRAMREAPRRAGHDGAARVVEGAVLARVRRPHVLDRRPVRRFGQPLRERGEVEEAKAHRGAS